MDYRRFENSRKCFDRIRNKKMKKFNFVMMTGSLLSDAGLSEWKSHIGGDGGSLEVDPALNANYMPANVQCAGMGIQSPLNPLRLQYNNRRE